MNQMEQLHNFNINEYISQCKIRLKRILDRLEWSEETTLKDFNTNSIAYIYKDVQKTNLSATKATYPYSCISKNSLVLDTSKLQEILLNNEVKAPDNFQELQGSFTREQKLTIYEHVIRNTQKLENNTLNQEVEGEISLAEILAQKKREEKRKKRRFRKSKPTHIEEVRCLVDLQMQALRQFMGNKIKNELPGTCHKGSTKNYHKKEYKNKERKRFDEDYRKEQKIGKSRENYCERNSCRSNSKEYVSLRHQHHKRSSSTETSNARKGNIKYPKKERRKRSRSSSREIRYGQKQSSSTGNIKCLKKESRKRSRSSSRESRYNQMQRSRCDSRHKTEKNQKHSKSHCKNDTKDKYSCRSARHSRSPKISKKKKHRSRSYEREKNIHKRSPSREKYNNRRSEASDLGQRSKKRETN